MNVINPTMLCSYRSYFLDVPVALVNCKAEVFPSHLLHVCQGGYVVLNCTDFDRAERKIFRNCVDKIQG